MAVSSFGSKLVGRHALRLGYPMPPTASSKMCKGLSRGHARGGGDDQGHSDGRGYPPPARTGGGLLADRPRWGAVPLEVVLMNRPVPVAPGVCIDVLHAQFLRLAPKIEGHARIFFRGVRCPVKQEDQVQECVALGWKWF